jgi:hypothetical protein
LHHARQLELELELVPVLVLELVLMLFAGEELVSLYANCRGN